LDLGVPLLLGSGVTADNLTDYAKLAQGAVVGTAIKQKGVSSAQVDPVRARALVKVRDGTI